MCSLKNNFFSKVAFLITLLVFKKKKKSQHPFCKLCTQKWKINKTLKLRKPCHIMARRPVHIFKPLTKTPLSSCHFHQLLSKELGSTRSLGWCSQLIFTFSCSRRFSTVREFSVQFCPLCFSLQLLLLSPLLL